MNEITDMMKKKAILKVVIAVVAVIAVLLILGYIGTDCGFCGGCGSMCGPSAFIGCAETCGSCTSCLLGC